MENSLKRNIQKFGIFILITALTLWLQLLLPLVPDMLRLVGVLLICIVWIILCLVGGIWGGMLILSLPWKKFFRGLVFIVWIPFYISLCWMWMFLIFMVYMRIFGP